MPLCVQSTIVGYLCIYLFLVFANLHQKESYSKVLECLPVSDVLQFGVVHTEVEERGVCLQDLTRYLQGRDQGLKVMSFMKLGLHNLALLCLYKITQLLWCTCTQQYYSREFGISLSIYSVHVLASFDFFFLRILGLTRSSGFNSSYRAMTSLINIPCTW